MSPLAASMFETFLERFGHFGDGVVRDVYVSWRPWENRHCSLVIECRDRDADWNWSEVTFTVHQIRNFYWLPLWHGSIECGELVLRSFGNAVYLAVGGADDESLSRPEGFDTARTSMFIIGESIEYKVQPFVSGK
jgi:hypothetical protein